MAKSPKASIHTYGPDNKIGTTRVRSGKLPSGKKYELVSQKFDLGGGRTHTSVKAKVTSPGKTVIREKDHGSEWGRRPRKDDTILREGTTPGGRQYKARAIKKESFQDQGGKRRHSVTNLRVDEPGTSYVRSEQFAKKNRSGKTEYSYSKASGEPSAGYTIRYDTKKAIKKGPTKKVKK